MSFTKKRTIPALREGIAMGLNPLTLNPLILTFFGQALAGWLLGIPFAYPTVIRRRGLNFYTVRSPRAVDPQSTIANSVPVHTARERTA
jgi:hypothetical protein